MFNISTNTREKLVDGDFTMYNKKTGNYRKLAEKYTIGVDIYTSEDSEFNEVIKWCESNIKKYKIDYDFLEVNDCLWIYHSYERKTLSFRARMNAS